MLIAELMKDMRHTSEQTFCHGTEGIPCCNTHTAEVQGLRETIEGHLGPTRTHWAMCKLLMETLSGLSNGTWNGKLTSWWAETPGAPAEQGGWHQAQVAYFAHRAADDLNGGAP